MSPVLSSFGFAQFAQKAFSSLGTVGQLLSDSSRFLGTPATLVINHLLVRHPQAQSHAAQFAEQTLQFRVGPVVQTFQIQANGLFKSVADPMDKADCTLSTDIGAVPQILTAPDNAMAHVRIEGSTELAQLLNYLSSTLRWDPEDDLSAIIGDSAAVRVMSWIGQMQAMSSGQMSRAKDTLRESVVYEQSILAEQSRFDHFVADVKTLRDDLSRLEKRVKQLSDKRQTR